jgi:exopolysaccharide biosynthesis polyprenyl glycosylphosphotransferase
MHFFLDVVWIFVAWIFYHLFLEASGLRLNPFHEYLDVAVLFATVSIVYLAARGFQLNDHLLTLPRIIQEIFLACLFGILSIGLFLYLLKRPHLSRFYIIGSVACSFFLLTLWNLIVYRVYLFIRKKGLNYQHIILIGNQHTLPIPVETIHNNPSLGQRILAILSIDENVPDQKFMGYKVFHGLRNLKRLLDEHVVDNALFTVYRQDPEAIEKAMLLCQERGIKVWLKPDFMHHTLVSRVDYLDRMPLFTFSLGPENHVSLAVKRLLDIISSILLLTLLAVPMGILALVVKLNPGSVLFRQKRVGLNGRLFVVLKFRTMYKDADLRRAEYNLKNEMKGPVFKMKDDPRITPTGKFLRKYSLDELPQIWNVLVGNMSLVGARPPLPTEVDLYKGWQRRRLSMRPGITCIWQVTGRNKITDFNEWARLDLKYIDEWSLWLDLKILLKTIPTVLKGTGL